MNVIRRWIDESDIYMLILGGRYGSIDPKSQMGYIELEYRYALEKSKLPPPKAVALAHCAWKARSYFVL
jgi:hypothetical protein